MAQKVRRTPAEEFVEYALKIGALELVPEGRKLKSGRISPYFFNSGLFNTGEAIDMIADAYSYVITKGFADLDGEPVFDVLYGPPYKGTILVPAIASIQLTYGLGNTRFCTSRKEAKDHGEGGTLIGSPIMQGDRVLIADDVISDGATKREAVEFIKHFGGVPVGLAIAFDRQERAFGNLSAIQEFERDFQIPAYAVAKLADLISVLEKSEKASDAVALGTILKYRDEYGVS